MAPEHIVTALVVGEAAPLFYSVMTVCLSSYWMDLFLRFEREE